MPSASDAAFWSCRAAETRAVAAQMTDPLSRTTMLALAARYERLANFIERDGDVARATCQPPNPSHTDCTQRDFLAKIVQRGGAYVINNQGQRAAM
jgi:hypothetical protein